MIYKTDRAAILLATYNGAKYLPAQLDSLLAQTYRDWTAYIHDDGSADDTIAVIDDYVKKYPEHFVLVNGAPTGCARDNFFYLLKSVEADTYLFCDQDDVWLPDKIEKSIRAMREGVADTGRPASTTKANAAPLLSGEEAPRLIFTELTVVDEDLRVISETMSRYQSLDCTRTAVSHLLIQNVITGCTTVINRPLRDRMLRAKHMEKIIMHDWWAGLIAAQYGSILFIAEPTILYRQHHGNSVGAINLHDKNYLINRARSYDKIKRSLKKTKIQAKEFAEVFEQGEDSLSARYARSDEMNKLRRLIFYFKNDICKTNLTRNVGLVIWG